MYKKISRTSEINARLEAEGKVGYLNTSADLAKINSMNQFMEQVRSDYHTKESRSHASASRIVLNA
jgi:hypothetical protein